VGHVSTTNVFGTPGEEALELTGAGQPLVRIAVLFELSVVAVEEGYLEEAESLSTVRTHIKAIYRKLGVSFRMKAVEQAYARGPHLVSLTEKSPLGEMRQ
jgi:hypothetical protein